MTLPGTQFVPDAPHSGTSLAERLVTAPRLIAPERAEATLAAWLAELAVDDRASIEAQLAAAPLLATLLQSLSESSPFLWELASRQPDRLLRLLRSDPDRHFPHLLADTARAVAAATDEAEAMRLLRGMKAEAALLIALADIGGVWPVMQAARALTELADTAVRAAVRFALLEAARNGRIVPRNADEPERDSGYIVLAMGKMGACELNYSSDIDLIVFFDAA